MDEKNHWNCFEIIIWKKYIIYILYNKTYASFKTDFIYSCLISEWNKLDKCSHETDSWDRSKISFVRKSKNFRNVSVHIQPFMWNIKANAAVVIDQSNTSDFCSYWFVLHMCFLLSHIFTKLANLFQSCTGKIAFST